MELDLYTYQQLIDDFSILHLLLNIFQLLQKIDILKQYLTDKELSNQILKDLAEDNIFFPGISTFDHKKSDFIKKLIN